MALAILLLIFGMRLPPFRLAVANDLCVLGVGFQFLAVVICPALGIPPNCKHTDQDDTSKIKRLLAISAAAQGQAVISSGVSNRPLMETRSDLSKEI